MVLADELVGCTQVEDDFSPLQCQFAAWWNGCPEVFANLYGEAGFLGVEEDVAAERHRLCTEVNLTGIGGSGWGEPSLLVEFLVVGKEGLGHDAEYLATLHDHSAVHQQSADHDRHANDGDDL